MYIQINGKRKREIHKIIRLSAYGFFIKKLKPHYAILPPL
jgi:hypothetical protein